MTKSPKRPAGDQRRRVSADQLVTVVRLTGAPVSQEDAAALLDPRGAHFQRLEWLGDSLLDALVGLHRWSAPFCCADVPQSTMVSDKGLAAAANRAGVARHLDWSPSPQRLADWVEAALAAAYRAGGLAAAAGTASRLVHPGLTVEPAPVPTVALSCRGLKPLATVGAHVLEAAAAVRLVESPAHAVADEGYLSALRGRLLDGNRLRQLAQGRGELATCGGTTAHLVDHVQAAAGLAAVRGGLDAGMTEADRLLGRR